MGLKNRSLNVTKAAGYSTIFMSLDYL